MNNSNQFRTLAAGLFAVALLLTNAASTLADVHYVDVNSTNATPPYLSWATAATNIQNAVDASAAGDEIVVTNGVYATGGRAYPTAGTDTRVAVDKSLNVHSINGPLFTTIDGGWLRCVYLTNGASLSGFTLTHGYAETGAGVFCKSQTAMLSNCVVSGNVAFNFDFYEAKGGGAYGGTLNNCVVSSNLAESGFDFDSGIDGRKASGGGAYGCTLNNCTLSRNRAFANNSNLDIYAQGGGAYDCTLNNCTLNGNLAYANYADFDAYSQGGGAYGCTLNNCSLSGNSVLTAGSHWGLVYPRGGGAYGGTLNNCVAYFNTAPQGANAYNSSLNYCWMASDPLFVDRNSDNLRLRLQSNSPCINAGLNALAPAGPDLDGNPRIVGGRVDIGAYEYQSLSLINFGIVSNQVGFNVTGQSNWVIVLEASSDFTNWTVLTTNTLGGSPFPFSDPTSPNLPQRFYRARQELP